MKSFEKTILLASQSPRRQQLIKESGFPYKIINIDVEENFPKHLKAEAIPMYLAQKKAEAYQKPIAGNEILVTADTIVWIDNHVLNKPIDMEDAKKMLNTLSGKMHQVFTGVCIQSSSKKIIFYDESKVFFNSLEEETINYYLENYKPLDKAGAYGVQEFIGFVGIDKIEGCFYNIMGFPMAKFYKQILNFI